MADLKITPNQLKNYLGTGLKYRLNNDFHEEFYDMEDSEGFQESFSKGSLWELKGYTDTAIPAGEGDLEGVIIQHENGFYMSDYHFADPIFYRLSDLDKFIPELGFVPIEILSDNTTFVFENEILYQAEMDGGMYPVDGPENLSWFVIQKLFQWHFWPFGDEYFEAGLIIDKLKLQ